MVGNCPGCDAAVELPGDGTYRCARCRTSFRFFRPSLPAAPAVETPRACTATDARCAFHPNNVALQTCERCGDLMCALCSTPTEGRSYCTRCFDLLYQRGSLLMTQRSFTLPRQALTLSMVSFPSLLVYGLGVLPAIAGIILGVMALKQISRRPDLSGRKQAVAAIALGILSLLLLAVALVALSFLPPFNS